MLRPCFALFVVLASALAASAQPVPPGGGPSRPAFGSYLGLLGGTGNPGINYLGFVRPQQQLAQQFGQIQQQQQQLATGLQQTNNNLALGADPFLPQTGVVARFNSLAPYYTRNPITGSGGALRGGGSSFGAGGGASGLAGGRSGGAAARSGGAAGARR